tara:strand:- start:7583 stop:7963 length:381 start_codon:yes stop_codon:yes gene_type:complete
MAAPNIVNVTSILGKTAYLSPVTTNSTAVLQNAASSNKVLKINTILAANIDGTNASDITVFITTVSGGVTAIFHLAASITVPADSSLVITSKDTSFYLEEDRQIKAVASSSNDLSLMISYEELDDA